MRQSVYDAFKEKSNYGSYNTKLFPFINLQDQKEVLSWLTTDIREKIDSRRTALWAMRKIEAMYKGIGYLPDSTRRFRDDTMAGDDGLNISKSFVNFVNEMVDAKVAQRSRFKPVIAVIPQSDELEDENHAELAKLALTSKAQEMDFETIFADGDKTNFLRGESYTYIYWDKDLGGENARYNEAKSEGITLEREDGSVIESVKNGDICIKVLGPDRAFHQLRKKNIHDCDDFSVVDFKHVDELKYDYPEVAGEISPDDMSGYYNVPQYEQDMTNMCMVVTYYHRPTKYLPNGAYVKYTRNAILEMSEFPYKHGKLPFIFDTDIDVPDEITGRPFTHNLERLQRLHDMVMYSTAKGFAVSASPKWVYPKGAVDPNKLSNKYSALEFKGPVAPQMVTFNGVNAASGDLLNMSERYVEKQSAVYGISRGEPPKGIKAAVALQFLDEQELQRESRGMAKRQRRIIDTNKMVLSLMQQYYVGSDGRFVKMLGEDNEYLIRDISKADFSRCYDIRIENSSALPDSKTGKVATILDINMATQNDPEGPYFKKNEITQILDLGNDRRFKNLRTASTKAAQYKISKILNGENVPEPRSFDDFLVEYPLFVETLQQREYKGEKPEIMLALEAYIKSMEFLMWEKAKMNPMFQQRVMAFTIYPIFFKVPMMAQMPPVQSAPMNTAALQSANNQVAQDQQQVINEQGV
jgi:hypothetical protein